MKSCLLLVALIVALLPATANAHILSDGVVERGVEVQVFDDHIHVKYLVGLNDNTMAALFADDAADKTALAAKYAADEASVDAAREKIAAMLLEKFQLSVGGQVLELEPEGNLNAGLHHMRFEFTYVAKIAAGTQPEELQIADSNFAAAPGSHRIALKGRLGVKVFGSNTDVILARIPRVEWETLSDDEKHEATNITGRFAKLDN